MAACVLRRTSSSFSRASADPQRGHFVQDTRGLPARIMLTYR